MLVFVAVGTLPLLLLEIDKPSLPRHDQIFINIVNVIVFGVFAIDYGVGLWLTNDRRAYVRAEWINLVIVLASAAAIVPDLGAFGSARALRGFQPLRGLIAITRVVCTGGLATQSGRAMVRRNAARYAMAIAFLTWFSAACAFTLAEDVGVDGRLAGFEDALWWSAATITTVGYGDVVPVTTAGRVIGVVTMVVGISTFAIVTARIASFLMADDS